MKYSKPIIAIVGLVISAVFLYLAFQGLNPAAVWADIQTANVPLILFGAAWYFVSLVIIAQRWGYLLRALQPLSLRQLTPLVCIGYMGNNVYPFRTGEVLRLVLLQRNTGIPVSRSAIVTVVERVFDGLVMLSFVVFGLALLNVESTWLSEMAAIATPFFAAALMIFFALAARPNTFRRLIDRCARLLPGKLRAIILKLTDDILHGLNSFRSPRDLIGAVVTSYLTWILHATVYSIVAIAFNLNFDFTTALLMVGVVNLAGLIPASPGMVGVFEFAVITVLGLVNVAEPAATAYALVIHLVIWLPVTAIGFILLTRQGLSWGAIRRAQDLQASGQLNEGKVVIP